MASNLRFHDELPPDSKIRLDRERHYASGEFDIKGMRECLKSRKCKKTGNMIPNCGKENRPLIEYFVADYERWLERQAVKSDPHHWGDSQTALPSLPPQQPALF